MNKKDLLFVSILQEFGAKQVEPVIKKATALFNGLLKSKRPEIILFGDYCSSTRIFTWKKEIRDIQYDMIINNYMSVFGDDSTLKKLFKDKVRLSSSYQHILAYLLKIVNASYHVIRISFKGHVYFALVKLPLEDPIDFEMFERVMMVYRMANKKDTRIQRRSGRTRTRKGKK